MIFVVVVVVYRSSNETSERPFGKAKAHAAVRMLRLLVPLWNACILAIEC